MGIFYGILLAVLVLNGLLLSVVVLLQSGKGGGLAAMGGGAAATEMLGGRQATNILTKASWIGGSVFMALSLTLAIMSSRNAMPTSVLETLTRPAGQTPQPVLDAAPTLEGVEALPVPEAPPPVNEGANQEDPPPPPPE